MDEWGVLFAFQAPEGTDEVLAEDDPRVEDLQDVLAQHAPVLVFGGPRWSVIISVTAEAADTALYLAEEIVRPMAAKVGMPDWPLVRADIVRADEQDRDLAEPNFPKVVGTSEVTELLGVSRQRVHEMRSAGRFPEPMVELAAGPIWLRSTIESFLDQWDRRPGRRSSGALEEPSIHLDVAVDTQARRFDK